ncbi:uncharacterized protein VTP21DRAFT_1148 [Calcarisporiella thermophila]|uniref:uncharacterized protein n=1 Tax=Calcarisporiella thermophila TaxID=911321 RepID=UPI003742B1EE
MRLQLASLVGLFSLAFAATPATIYLVTDPSAQHRAQDFIPTLPFTTAPLVLSHLAGVSRHVVLTHQDALNAALPHRSMFEGGGDNVVVLVEGADEQSRLLPVHDPSFRIEEPPNVKEFDKILGEVSKMVEHETPGLRRVETDVGYLVSESEDLVNALPKKKSPADAFAALKVKYAELDVSSLDPGAHPETSDFVTEVEALADLASSFSKHRPTESSKANYITYRISGLNQFSRQSQQYKTASKVLKDLFEKTVIPDFNQGAHSTIAFILVPPDAGTHASSSPNPLSRRQLPTSPGPLCYESQADCEAKTNKCSDHGSCKSVGKCFVCQCEGAYGGDACELANIMPEFHILLWTSVFLIFAVVGSTLFLWRMGKEDHSNMSGGPNLKQE